MTSEQKEQDQRQRIEECTNDLMRSLPLPAIADDRDKYWGETVRKILRKHFGGEG